MRAIGCALVLAIAAISPVIGSELTPYQTAMLKQVDGKLPMRVSSNMLLTDVTYVGTQLTYYYRVEDKPQPGFDVAKVRAEKLDGFCGEMREFYRPGETTAMEHNIVFADDTKVTIDVTMADCQAKSDADFSSFMAFAREMSGK